MDKFRRLIIVDDDDISCFLHEMVFRDMEIAEQTLCIPDARQALKYVSKNYYGDNQSDKSLIFVEMNMRGLDGFEFLDELKKLNGVDIKKFVVFMTTCYASQRDLTKADTYKDILQDIIEKPLSEEKIRGLIDNLPPLQMAIQ